MTAEQILDRIAALAAEADRAAEEIRPIEEIPGEIWVSVNGIADDLESLERELRYDLTAARS